MKSEFSIVIQGPLSVNTLLMVKYHSDKYETTIVAPRDSNMKIANELHSIIKDKKHKVSLFLYNPEVEYENPQNRYYQIYSTTLGLQNSNSLYSIKFRSDEFYSNIEPFIEAIKTYPNRIVTSDIFFRKSTSYKYHISDHVIGGKTELMLEGLEFALKVCKKEIDITNHENFTAINVEKMAVEQLITLSFLNFLTTKHMIKDHIESMKENFFIVSVEKTGLYLVKQNSKTEEYSDYEFFNEDTDINDIEKYV